MEKAKVISGKENITIMEVCGSHTEIISKYALGKLYEDKVKLVSGPGCPVCVTSPGEIDEVIEYAKNGFAITTFGDLLKVPGTNSSLAEEKSLGADIKIVYSPLQALEYAKENPTKSVVFIGIGFETTAPTIALTIKKAQNNNINNFSVLSLHKRMPPIINTLLKKTKNLDGLILPGHVCSIIGAKPFNFILEKYNIMGVVSGFTPEDVVESIKTIIKNQHNPFLHIQYKRAVTFRGNEISQKVIREVFDFTNSYWRGFGIVEDSGFAIKEKWSTFDVRKKYGIKPKSIKLKNDEKCMCSKIIQGISTPRECVLFTKNCKPNSPKGPCMATSEGPCFIYYKFGR